jgi:hypothetical protein
MGINIDFNSLSSAHEKLYLIFFKPCRSWQQSVHVHIICINGDPGLGVQHFAKLVNARCFLKVNFNTL